MLPLGVIIGAIVAILAALIARHEGNSVSLLGQVLWPGNALLPQHLQYRVSLVDLTVKDAPTVIASTTERLSERGTGLPFTLTCLQKHFRPERVYGLWAELIDGDKVTHNSRLATLTGPTVDTAVALPVQPAVDIAIKAPPSIHNVLPVHLAGTRWRILAADGAPGLPDNANTLQIAANGQLAGLAGGRQYFAEAAFQGEQVEIVHLVVSAVADRFEELAQQQRVLEAILAARRYRSEGSNLVLVDSAGKDVLTLAPEQELENSTLH